MDEIGAGAVSVDGELRGAAAAAAVSGDSPRPALNPSLDQPPQREIRFAVVIYGGVSLAIYINGVVQEMLHMVRATAENADVENLTAVEKVYRRLGQIVGAPKKMEATEDTTKSAPTGVPAASEPFLKSRPGKAGLIPEMIEDLEHNLFDDPRRLFEPVKARFVVDILSGTSAGGINAIFMAKALANNMTIDSLAEMWVTEADLNKLLNDKELTPSRLRQKSPPSLLNSPWMYYKLLTALAKMNDTEKSGALVEDLDLFCTTTDLRGLPVKIALTDESVEEQRYRNVYHFRRRSLSARDDKDDHDFSKAMDPFLAFAARCTSSFPVAFEPMMLNDVLSVVKGESEFGNNYLGKAKTETKTEAQFPSDRALSLFGPELGLLLGSDKFAEICTVYGERDGGGHFGTRPFGDGGYLNNKPFTYAIETLKKRHATLPVDRKLIYVEPGPEDADDATQDGTAGRPNAVENSLDALVVLPRYETIRQDIESIIQWNSDISRLRRVIDHIGEEIKKADAENRRQKEDVLRGRGATDADVAKGLAEEKIPDIDTVSYRIYRRLRLSDAADQLGYRLADALLVEPSSAEGQALRVIAGEWRLLYFTSSKTNPDDHAIQQRFLDFFDFNFCERAIRFLRGRLQQLDAKEEDERQKKQTDRLASRRRSTMSDGRFPLAVLAEITFEFQAYSDTRLDLSLRKQKPLLYECWNQYLQFIVDPRYAAFVLGVPDECGVRMETMDNFASAFRPDELTKMLSTSEAGRSSRVHWLFEHEAESELILTRPQGVKGDQKLWRLSFLSIVAEVATIALKGYSSASPVIYDSTARPPLKPVDGPSALQALHLRLGKLFRFIEQHGGDGEQFFKEQDEQLFPVIFGTNLGEFEPVEMFRISPRDTRELAGTNPPGSQAKPALAGAKLANFGAFLDQDWRMSDMLSGRLDGAERLITAVLPDSDERTVKYREYMIKMAQEAIAEEWVEFEDRINSNRSPEKQVQVDRILKQAEREARIYEVKRVWKALADRLLALIGPPKTGKNASGSRNAS